MTNPDYGHFMIQRLLLFALENEFGSYHNSANIDSAY